MKDITLFFSPHQDDELLSMGIGIIESLKEDETHVILCTDGSKSSVRKVLNDKKPCKFSIGIHKYDLNEEQFVMARDKEFLQSCKLLGVKDENIHISKMRTVDGGLTIKESKQIIKYYLNRYKNAKVRTITPFGCAKQHDDHKNLGMAALELYNEGQIKDLEFYIEPYLYKEFLEINEISVQTKSTNNEKMILKAIKSYKTWKPKHRKYAIGYHSTRRFFNDFKKEKLAYSHKQLIDNKNININTKVDEKNIASDYLSSVGG